MIEYLRNKCYLESNSSGGSSSHSGSTNNSNSTSTSNLVASNTVLDVVGKNSDEIKEEYNNSRYLPYNNNNNNKLASVVSTTTGKKSMNHIGEEETEGQK